MEKTFKRPAELILLLGMVLFLPLLEAPKNLLGGAWVIAWLYYRVRDGDYGGSWDGWDILIPLWIASGYVVAAFAGIHNREWDGANDLLRYGVILWLVKRSGYREQELQWLIVATIISGLIALGDALWSLYVTHSHHLLELRSVGHVNHSAIYLAISYSIASAALMAYWTRLGWTGRMTGLLSIGAFSAGVFISASRGAVGFMIAFTLMMGLAWLRKSRTVAVVTVAALMASLAVVYFSKPDVVTKYEARAAAGDMLSYRGQVWNVALEAWRHFPLFGVGMDNYKQISLEQVKQWVEASGRVYTAGEYMGNTHAHSLYLNTLVERGLFGFGMMMTVLSAWFYWLLRHLPGARDEAMTWMLWGGSFGAWLVTVGVGTVNTTLHHEHAILSMVMLGAWLAYLKLRAAHHPPQGGN
jgi:O-antigen ligase